MSGVSNVSNRSIEELVTLHGTGNLKLGENKEVKEMGPLAKGWQNFTEMLSRTFGKTDPAVERSKNLSKAVVELVDMTSDGELRSMVKDRKTTLTRAISTALENANISEADGAKYTKAIMLLMVKSESVSHDQDSMDKLAAQLLHGLKNDPNLSSLIDGFSSAFTKGSLSNLESKISLKVGHQINDDIDKNKGLGASLGVQQHLFQHGHINQVGDKTFNPEEKDGMKSSFRNQKLSNWLPACQNEDSGDKMTNTIQSVMNSMCVNPGVSDSFKQDGMKGFFPPLNNIKNINVTQDGKNNIGGFAVTEDATHVHVTMTKPYDFNLSQCGDIKFGTGGLNLGNRTMEVTVSISKDSIENGRLPEFTVSAKDIFDPNQKIDLSKL